MTKSIEIHGTGTHNRGAELMTIAICQRVWAQDPDVQVVVPYRFGSYRDRAKYGLMMHDEFPRSKPHWGVWARMAPTPIRKVLGMVPVRDIAAVLDASGFAYSDQWGAKHAAALSQKMSRPGRRHQSLYLLPQAFGPFEQEDVRTATRRLLDRAHWVAARDPESHAFVKPLVDENKLTQFPDFTIGLESRSSEHLPVPDSFVAIVPNLRMTDMTGPTGGPLYLEMLATLFQQLRAMGEQPVLVLHDAHEDRKILPELNQRVDAVTVIEHPDPLVLKSVLGRARMVIGSRFHALVSALSMGTPSIALGWSHKYQRLLEEFACPEMRLDVQSEPTATQTFLADVLSPESLANRRSALKAAGRSLKGRIDQMWQNLLPQLLT